MDKYNFKKLLCYNIVNNCKCVYKSKCMFAHTLEEQKKEPLRQYIHNMLYLWDDLSDININDDKILLDELILMTKECKNCFAKKCPGGYNCKFGVCLRENKICYNDLMYGKCYNMLMESNDNGIILNRCISGIHLTEKKFIPYNQRMLSDLTNIEINFLIRHTISFNSKHNIISLILNENTLQIAKEIILNKLSKSEIMDNLKLYDNSSIENKFKNNNENIDDTNIIKYNKEEILNNIIIHDELNNKNINFSNILEDNNKKNFMANYKIQIENFNNQIDEKIENFNSKIIKFENIEHFQHKHNEHIINDENIEK